LQEVAGDTPIHFVSNEDMEAFRGSPERVFMLAIEAPAEALFSSTLTRCMIPRKSHVIFHEATHAVLLRQPLFTRII
jgi:hypothetical protein